MADIGVNKKEMEDAEKAVRAHREAVCETVQRWSDQLTKFCQENEDAFANPAKAEAAASIIQNIKTQAKNANLNLRWTDDAGQPVVKLGTFEKGTIPLTTVERAARKSLLASWPKFKIEVAGSGQGSNLTPELGRAGGLQSMARLSANARKQKAKSAVTIREEKKAKLS